MEVRRMGIRVSEVKTVAHLVSFFLDMVEFRARSLFLIGLG